MLNILLGAHLQEALPEDLEDVEADDKVPKTDDGYAADSSSKPDADNGGSGGKEDKPEVEEPPKSKVHPFFGKGARAQPPKSSAKGAAAVHAAATGFRTRSSKNQRFRTGRAEAPTAPLPLWSFVGLQGESKGDTGASEPESRQEEAPDKGGDEAAAAEGSKATGGTAAPALAKAPANPFFAKKGKEGGGNAASEAQPGEEGSAAMAAFEAMIKATTSRATKLKASAKDGVGAAAMAAAEQHRHFKPDAYITWKVKHPPPPLSNGPNPPGSCSFLSPPPFPPLMTPTHR